MLCHSCRQCMHMSHGDGLMPSKTTQLDIEEITLIASYLPLFRRSWLDLSDASIKHHPPQQFQVRRDSIAMQIPVGVKSQVALCLVCHLTRRPVIPSEHGEQWSGCLCRTIWQGLRGGSSSSGQVGCDRWCIGRRVARMVRFEVMSIWCMT
jgi:hypothetical protein